MSFSSKDVCPSYTLNALWEFLEKYQEIWGAIFILGGIFLCFFGRKLFAVAIFMICAFATTFLILLFFYALFLEDDTADWVGWTVLISAGIVGLIVGVIMIKLQRVGAAILAGWGGFMLGLLINETVLYKAKSEALFWCVGIAVAIVFALLTFIIYNHVLINATAFMGAYFFWRGISLYLGGFPNEFELIKQVQEGAAPHVERWFYAYLVAIVVSCAAGAFVQYKQLKVMTEEEKHPYQKLR